MPRINWVAWPYLAAKAIGLFAMIILAVCPCAAKDAMTHAQHSCIALVDVQRLLDQHPALQRRQQEIEAGAALAEATIALRKREIGRLTERLAALRAGSAEHAELDLKLIRQKAELRAQIAQAREKLSAEKARAHAAAYQEIVRAVEDYLQEAGYRVVLRMASAAGERHETVISGTASPVPRTASPVPSAARPAGESPFMPSPLIFAQAGVDITPDILRRLQGGPRKAAGRMRRASPH